jgi:competence protein ComEC
MLAVPVVSFLVVPLSLLVLALLQIVPDIANLLLQLIDQVLQVLWQVLEYLVNLPMASIVHPKPQVWQMLLAMLGILLLLAPKGIPGDNTTEAKPHSCPYQIYLKISPPYQIPKHVQ